MSKTLAIIAAAGLTLCAVFLSGAWLLGGDGIFRDPRSLEGLKPLINLATHKEWGWAGGDTLALDAPMTIRYQPQGKPDVTITGSAEAMDHVQFGAGRIATDMTAAPRVAPKLRAVVTGVPIREFFVNGDQNLQLGHIDQDELTIHINGQGIVSGDGRVRNLTVMMAGPGRANLGALNVDDAVVSVLGSGDVTLSPHGTLKLFVAGGARIKLLTRPASIVRRILGDAVVETPDGVEDAPVAARPPQPPLPPSPPAEAAQASTASPPAPRLPPAPPAPGRSPGKMHRMITLHDQENLDLGHIDQDRLHITLAGTASVTAEGRVGSLTLDVLGGGSARLGSLQAGKVVVRVMGTGSATIAPHDIADIRIMGTGNVHLATKPDRIEQRVLGTGRIIADDGAKANGP